MHRRTCLFALLFSLASGPALAADKDPTRVLEPGRLPADHRLGKPKTLNDYFPFEPPATREAWKARRQAVREQVLVANGLWPMPEKIPLHPVIHGTIDRDDYTVEKVFFASYPGHYVSGNLYRPKGRAGKLPGVLCPHGHWPNGRFYDLQAERDGEKRVQEQIKKGAEKTVAGARFPLQARCAQLARMGCVVFHYDMVGYADSQQIPHRQGFRDAQALLRLQSFMGLQTYNSIRALDFLLSLPDVDARRIGVTGASGGGTQTFILGAVDDRPAVEFPAVMVSTAMQGGCVCENAPYLRIGTGNVEFAGLFAPRPLGMTGANDWTLEIETKGLPQLKALYRLYGAEDQVLAKAFPQFEHNYNQVSREVMYNWFNWALRLGQPEPVTEKPFVPVPPRELSVYDAEHPRPADATDAQGLRKYMSRESDKQMEALRPRDAGGLDEFRRVVSTALRVLIADRLPGKNEVEAQPVGAEERHEGVRWHKALLGRKGQHEQIPAVELLGPQFDGTVVIWIHPAGKASLLSDGRLVPAARQILDRKAAILAPDVFLTGEFGAATRGLPALGASTVGLMASPLGQGPFLAASALIPGRTATRPAVDRGYAGFTFGYNRPLLADRVHDIVTVVAHARDQKVVTQVDLIGFDEAGPWVVLAGALCGDAVARTAADLNQFQFENVQANTDAMMLPGALKYGGLQAFAALCAPQDLLLHDQAGSTEDPLLRQAYDAAGATHRLKASPEKLPPEKAVVWLLR